MPYPQAVGLRSVRSDRQLMEAMVGSGRGNEVFPPRIVEANGAVFQQKPEGVIMRQIQNCGTLPVKFLIDNNADCTKDNFHGILAGGSVVDDGLGSIMNFNATPDRISIFCTGTPRLATLEVGIDAV